MCDCGRVDVVQRAGAPAVPGGQRWDRQPLLNEPGDVLHCLGDEGAVPVLLPVSVRQVSVPLLCFVDCLRHSQLPAGGGFRGGAFPFDKTGVRHRGAEQGRLHTPHRLIGEHLGFFGLTGSFVVMVIAPHGFVRVVGGKQAGGKWGSRRVAEVEPLCNSSYNFLSLLQQAANQGIRFISRRSWRGAPRRLGHGEILETS